MTTAHALPDGDRVLRALGIHRLSMPVPFVDAGGPVNAYAIEDGHLGLAFFDTGIGTAEGVEALHAGAEAAGLDLRRCTQIFVSHGHVDHCGNAQLLSELSGAPVRVHPGDMEKVVGESVWETRAPVYAAFLRRQGVPEEQLPVLAAMGRHTGKFSRRVDASRARPLIEGERFRVGKLRLEVLHLPGHTPGLVCLWNRRAPPALRGRPPARPHLAQSVPRARGRADHPARARPVHAQHPAGPRAGRRLGAARVTARRSRATARPSTR